LTGLGILLRKFISDHKARLVYSIGGSILLLTLIISLNFFHVTEYRITFCAEVDSGFDIFSVNPDGANLKRITNPQQHFNAVIRTQDSTKILCVSSSDDGWETRSMNADGEVDKIIVLDDYPWDLRMSPDNSKIAFGRTSYDNVDIWVIDADGSNLRRITNFPEQDSEPEWSPDGTKLVFNHLVNEAFYLYVINIDGSNPKQLTNRHTAFCGWSPDGRSLVAETEQDDRTDIAIIQIDHANNIVADITVQNSFSPAWSPDGEKVLLMSERDGKLGSYIMNNDGTNIRRLTYSDSCPTWSPDGKKISFVSGQSDTVDLEKKAVYVMNADGSDIRKVTDTSYEAYCPKWSPDCSKIIFSSGGYYGGQIYIVNVDGSNLINLSADFESPCCPWWNKVSVSACEWMRNMLRNWFNHPRKL
jgi:TolB protein